MTLIRDRGRRDVPAPAAGRLARLAALLCLALLPAAFAAAQTALPGAPPALPGAAASGLEQPQFLPVEEAYPLAAELTGERSLRLVWQMPPGYYLYRHAFRFNLQSGGRTVEPEAVLPPAQVQEDEYFGRVEVYYDSADIALRSPVAVRGSELTVRSQGCADAGLCYPPRTQRFRIGEDGAISELAAATPAPAAPARAGSGGRGGPGALPGMALLAFAGGLILNLMPCVFPILSLKVLSLASTSGGAQRAQGWYYSAGVVFSFVAVAALLLLLRGAGQAVGWGFQLQSPTFVIALAYLFTVMGLALSGVIELGSSLMNAGSSLAARGGSLGSFFTGVLAVLVASPCTAPFMGTALGFALTQPPVAALTVFAALGAGMAAPLLLLSYSAAARRQLPRPGRWMETLRQALAFPLYATALWLFWVVGRQAGVDAMATSLLGALLLALALWAWRRGRLARLLSVACSAAALLLALWRPGAPGDSGQPDAGHLAYTPLRLQELLDSGRPVFVDVTADWCITCLANERTVLATRPVREAFRSSGVAYLVADWTDYDPAIADFVASHGRSGIPLYVLYDPASGAAPQLLPQLLRRGVLLEALEGLSPAPAVGSAQRPATGS